ncbi:hypothetical protein PG985_001972 [Apiospora marii]|uniref:Uncharacterized protein n=1 Tax=Apiospora marii TaxID=335849 RepID=A0ABR1RYF2_9PEZI
MLRKDHLLHGPKRTPSHTTLGQHQGNPGQFFAGSEDTSYDPLEVLRQRLSNGAYSTSGLRPVLNEVAIRCTQPSYRQTAHRKVAFILQLHGTSFTGVLDVFHGRSNDRTRLLRRTCECSAQRSGLVETLEVGSSCVLFRDHQRLGASMDEHGMHSLNTRPPMNSE